MFKVLKNAAFSLAEFASPTKFTKDSNRGVNSGSF